MPNGSVTTTPRPSAFAPVTDLLLPSDRIARLDLQVWAANLIDRLQVSEPDPASLSVVLNNAALVFAHLGRLEQARWVCNAHIGWVRQLAASGDTSPVHALQPWINLGRIELLTGNPAAAQAYFDLVRPMQECRPVQLGSLTIEPADWPGMLAVEPQLPAVLRSVRLLDGVRCWFVAGDYRGALRWLDRIEREEQVAPPAGLQEARVIGHVELGEHEAAVAVARVRSADLYVGIAIRLHLARSGWLHGRPQLAGDLAMSAAKALLTVGWPAIDRTLLPRMFRLLEAAARTARALGRDEAGHRLAETLLDNAVRAGDQVSSHAALRHLCAITHGADQQHWEAIRENLESASDYLVVRRAAGLPPAPDRAVYASLLSAVRRCVADRAA
jgi:hypothetical protein